MNQNLLMSNNLRIQEHCSVIKMKLQLIPYDLGKTLTSTCQLYLFYYRYSENRGNTFYMAKDLSVMFIFQKSINVGMCKGYGSNA